MTDAKETSFGWDIEPAAAERPVTSTVCLYDWQPGFEGKRLHCVADHLHGAGRTTVMVLPGSRTIEDLLRAGGLTCNALSDALAARQRARAAETLRGAGNGVVPLTRLRSRWIKPIYRRLPASNCARY